MQKSRRIKIIFVGGGTGGHVSPNLAIIDELEKTCRRKKVDLDILYVGRMKGIEKEVIAKKGIRYKGILAGKLRRYLDWRNFTDPLLIFLGFLQSLLIVALFRPNIVFAKGGFVTVPFGIASWLLGRKLVIHESDSVLGLSNKMLTPFAKKVLLGFPLGLYSKIPKERSFFVGNPVRGEIANSKPNKEAFYKKYGLTKNKKVVFAFGGSQGSQNINKVINSVLKELVEKYVLIHATGSKEAGYFKEGFFDLKEEDRKDYLAYSYIGDEMGEFFSNADIVIGRGSASTIAEIIALRKISILVPLPSAAADHQRKNVNYLQKNKMVSGIDEKVLDGRRLLDEIDFLMENKKQRTIMQKNMEGVFPENSSRAIVDQILKILPL